MAVYLLCVSIQYIIVLHALCVTAAATLRFTGRKAGRLTAKHHWAAAQLSAIFYASWCVSSI